MWARTGRRRGAFIDIYTEIIYIIYNIKPCQQPGRRCAAPGGLLWLQAVWHPGGRSRGPAAWGGEGHTQQAQILHGRGHASEKK